MCVLCILLVCILSYVYARRYNMHICPWPLNDVTKHGCSIPGTDNSQADTSANQAAIWALSFTNHLLGNRAANSFNGMLFQVSVYVCWRKFI